MNKWPFNSKTNRESIDEVLKQIINLSIEFHTALKYLKENSSPNPGKDNKYIEALEIKIQITENRFQTVPWIWNEFKIYVQGFQAWTFSERMPITFKFQMNENN